MQSTQASGMFAATNSSPSAPVMSGGPVAQNPGGGEGFASSYGLGGNNPNASQGYVSGTMGQAYTNPIRRPGQAFRRM
jgi:hypothetical protein